MANTSKTARASMRGPASSGAFVRAAGVDRFVSLGQGTGAYIYTDAGLTLKAKVGTAEFADAVAGLLAGRDAETVIAQMTSLDAKYPGKGWGDALAAAQAPAEAEELASAA